MGRLRIHLSREICKLTDVSRILEQNHVVGDRLVGLLYEIVDNHQRRFFTVKVLDNRKTLVKFCVGCYVLGSGILWLIK